MKNKHILMAGLVVLAAVSIMGCRSKTRAVEALNLPEGVESICGSSSILGYEKSPITEGSCGIEAPVEVHAVNGIKLDEPAVINCQTARSLSNWIRSSLNPSAEEIGRSVSELYVMQGYSCRTRNHRAGARLSEHSFGNAIDIGGFTFSDGESITVKNDYGSDRFGGFLRSIRSGACGPFGTVLGPGVAQHSDHFHFDVAEYSNGPYCR